MTLQDLQFNVQPNASFGDIKDGFLVDNRRISFLTYDTSSKFAIITISNSHKTSPTNTHQYASREGRSEIWRRLSCAGQDGEISGQA